MFSGVQVYTGMFLCRRVYKESPRFCFEVRNGGFRLDCLICFYFVSGSMITSIWSIPLRNSFMNLQMLSGV